VGCEEMEEIGLLWHVEFLELKSLEDCVGAAEIGVGKRGFHGQATVWNRCM
jgi:hypothetical protein